MSRWGLGITNKIGTSLPDARALLRLAYIGRVCVAIAVFVAAAFYFKAVAPGTLLMVAVAAVLSVSVSAVSVWYTEVRQVAPGLNYLYAQTIFDLVLVTVVVQATGGVTSDFASLYILVITLSALLLPLASSLLVTLLAGVLYFGVVFWFSHPDLSATLGLQLGLFLVVALVTNWIASRVSLVGAERRVLEQEVARLRLEASDILDSLSSGIITVGGDGILSYSNIVARKLLGLSETGSIEQSASEILHPIAPELERVIEQTRSDGVGVSRFEAEIRRDGNAFPIGVATTSIDAGDGGPLNVSAIFTDISESKRLEELKLQNERLAAVAELSASLAHEIKNPLASIRSSVEQLSGSMQAGEDEKFLAQLVVRESDRLSRLLSEFLDFSSVSVTQRTKLNLLELASAAAKVAQEHPDCRSETEILVEGDAVEIEGDEDLLHRVVFNLVLNAIQAAGDKAHVTVTVRRAKRADIPGGVSIEKPALVKVVDNGPGIPGDLLNRLFEPFVTGRVGGSGLGLAIVQRAVDAHQGLVFAESVPGRGTTFTVLLPSCASSEIAA